MKIKNLSLVFLCLYLFTACSQSNFTVVQEENLKYNLIDKSGKKIFKDSFDEIKRASSKYYIVEKDSKKGLYSIEKEAFSKIDYDEITLEFNNLFVVKKDGKYTLINENLREILDNSYEEIINEEQEIIFLKSNKKWSCYLDERIKQEKTFDEVYSYSENKARVVIGDKWGFIDKNCDLVVEAKYDFVSNFINGYAKVFLDGKIIYIDSKAKEISKKTFVFGQYF